MIPQPRSSLPRLEVRHPVFRLSAELPRYWHGGDVFRTHFFNALSGMFPEAERHFVETVRLFQQEIADPGLAAEVRGFLGQETVHGNEHRKYNDLLRTQGYDIAGIERRVARRIAFGRRVLPVKNQLAVVLAYEHFTAILADLALREPRVLGGAHPAYAALWRWHAAEEIEHKAVAFDVYREVGGGYLRRVHEMLMTSLLFCYDLLRNLAPLLHRDGKLLDLRVWARGFVYLFIAPGVFRRLLPAYLSYYGPRFHPWKHDNRDLVEAWKAGGAAEADTSASRSGRSP